MISKDIVNEHVEAFIAETEYYLVDVNISNNNCISIEIDSFEGVSIEYCCELNKFIESKFDREIEDFELEVSSAGLTEPFKVLKQYEKNIGNEVEVLTKSGKKYTGLLIYADEDKFLIQIEKTEKPEGSKRKITITEDLTFGYNDIKHTKYIIRFK